MELRFSELSAPTFKALLTFMYKGTCTFNESCLTEVLEAASRLLMPALQEAAVGAMIARLNEANAIESWDLADRLMLSELSSHALEYVSFHFQTIAASDAWLSAPLQLVLRLLPQDELGVEEEEAVFRAAVRWVRAQERQPNEPEMRSLFAAVRFPLLSFSFVQSQVQPEPLLAAPWAKDLLTTSLLRFVHGVEKSLPRELYPKLRVLNCSSEGGDEDGSVDVFREIACGNADIPFGVFPFGVFVVGEGAGGDGVDGLAFEFEVAGLMEELEDVGFAGTSGGTDDDVGAGAEVIDGLMLPEIGEFEVVDRGEHGPSVREASY
jgi:hypothetical protein